MAFPSQVSSRNLSLPHPIPILSLFQHPVSLPQSHLPAPSSPHLSPGSHTNLDHLRDATASLPFPPAHLCSTGKKSTTLSPFFFPQTADKTTLDATQKLLYINPEESSQLGYLTASKYQNTPFRIDCLIVLFVCRL